MAKSPMGALLAAPMVDPSSSQPLYQQVYQRIRELILEGKLPRGARLPSSRTLADDLSLSRNTISSSRSISSSRRDMSRADSGTVPTSRPRSQRTSEPSPGATPNPSPPDR